MFWLIVYWKPGSLNRTGMRLKFRVLFQERGTESYGLTIVGHSLGAGVASILAFLLRPKYPALTCFAYSAVGSTFKYVNFSLS